MVPEWWLMVFSLIAFWVWDCMGYYLSLLFWCFICWLHFDLFRFVVMCVYGCCGLLVPRLLLLVYTTCCFGNFEHFAVLVGFGFIR